MGIKDRLVTFISHLGIKNAEFERVCGLSNGFVANTNDRIRKASLNQISTAFPQLNMEWVINGTGEMLLPKELTKSTLSDLIDVVSKLVAQGEMNAEANRINAEANLRHAKNFERLIALLESNGNVTIEKAIG